MSPTRQAITTSSSGSMLRSTPANGGASSRADDDSPGADGTELRLQRRGGAGRVERHRDRTDAEHCEVGDDEVPVVGDHDPDPVTRLDAEADQPTAQPGDLLSQLAVGRALRPADESHRVGTVRLHDGGQVHAVAPSLRSLTAPESSTPDLAWLKSRTRPVDQPGDAWPRQSGAPSSPLVFGAGGGAADDPGVGAVAGKSVRQWRTRTGAERGSCRHTRPGGRLRRPDQRLAGEQGPVAAACLR